MANAGGAPLADLAAALLAEARKRGASQADVIAVESGSVSADVLRGRLEHAERAEAAELGLRVIIGKRQACVATSDLRPAALAAVAERAVAMARAAPEDPAVGLADPALLATDTDAGPLELADPGPEPEPGELEAAALAAEEAALSVQGISQSEGSHASFDRRRIHLATSTGFSAGRVETHHALSASAIIGEGTHMERDGYGESRIFRDELAGPAEIGRRAAERALQRQGARKPPTGAVPVVFDERVAATLVGHLLMAISGTAVARGASWLAEAMGEPVLPPGISLLEEPRRRRGPASRPFDAEGLPTRNRALVEEGRLAGWLLDLGTARRLNLASTGNAVRGTSSPPNPAPSNVRLTEGEASREDLLHEMGRGLLVTSLLGASINPTTGDYSRGASGHWVENGRIAYAVNECTIAGNLREMLRSTVPANDARPWSGRVVPSLLLRGLTVAGA